MMNKFIQSICCCCRRRQNSRGGEGALQGQVDTSDYSEDADDIFEIVIRGDLTGLESFYTRHGHVDADNIGFNGYKPMHVAVTFGHLDIIKSLIAKGAKYDEPDPTFRNTPLALAVYHECEDIIKFLISLDCNFHNIDHEHDTALHYCGRNGMSDVAKLLIDKGADVNAKNIFGVTPLWYAVRNGHMHLLRTLLDYTNQLNDKYCGSDCNSVYVYLTPVSSLYVAVENDDLPSVQLLIKAGYKLNSDELRQLENTENSDCFCFLQKWSSTAPTLKDLCRIAIRDVIGLNIRRRVQLLDIPKELKDFLLLTR